jgi:orotidine-5'-phosphate decarboxylase
LRQTPGQYPAEQCVVLAVENFKDGQVSELLSSTELSRYIRGIKVPEEMAHHGEHDRFQTYSDLARTSGLELIFDVQLAGIGKAMETRYRKITRSYYPSSLTVARGVGASDLRFLVGATADMEHAPGLYLTAVLPETDPEDLDEYGDKESAPLLCTRRCMHVADFSEINATGVYGASVYASAGNTLNVFDREYMGAGISLDGQPYPDNHGRMKPAMKAGEAILAGCTMLVIGSALSNSPNPLHTMGGIGEGISEAIETKAA